MYCKKCGKKLTDSDIFCPSCGESVNEESQSTQAKPADSINSNGAADINAKAAKLLSSKGKYAVSSICASILLIILLLSKWINVPMLRNMSSLLGGAASSNGSYSILKLVFSLKGVAKSGYLPSSSRVIMVLLILTLTVLLVLSIYFLGRFTYEFFSKNEKNIGRFKSGLICTIILFVVCFFGMLIINSTISDKTYGLYSEALSLTGGAYFTGIAAVLAKIFLVKKFEEETNQKN